MTRALPLLLLAAVAGGQAAGERAFLETVVERDTWFDGEPIRVTLRIGFDRSFFDRNVVQMFQRELDLPVQVSAPWLDELGDVIIREGEEPERGVSFALNGEEALGTPAEDLVEGGVRWGVIEFTRVYIPTGPAVLDLQAPTMRFTYGTEIREDFFGGRTARDPRDAFVVGEPVKLKVEALPDAGRPEGFNGPVGPVTVRAEADPPEVEAGRSLEVVLRIDGDENLEFFDAPRLERLAGFHSYGLTDDEDPSHRTVRYHLVPLDASVREIPAIAVVWFDREARTYRTARTEPIPITVHPRPGAAEPPATAPPVRGFPWLPAGAAAVAALLALALWLRARARRARAPGPAAVFRARVARPGADLPELFADFLAAYLRCPTASVITPDLEARLTAAGVSGTVAARTAKLVERLVAARYGGAPPGDDALAEAHALVDAFEAALHAAGRGAA